MTQLFSILVPKNIYGYDIVLSVLLA